MLMLASVLLLSASPLHALAQSKICLENDQKQGLSYILRWSVPAEPTRIAGPIYFVGTKGLGVWLITTSQGHILLNTGASASGPMIEEAIRKLKFNPEDIKLLLTGHAHIDHVGGHAHIRQISGARVALIDREVELLESGGKTDFHYGNIFLSWFKRMKVDKTFKDGHTIKVGDATLTARLTAGHTKGSTTWTMNVVEGGVSYKVVFPDGASVNPGYRVEINPSYPGIGDDYRRTFSTLEALKPDIWLAPHTDFFDFEGKRTRATREGATAWVDPEGYRCWVAHQRRKFEAAVNAELADSANGK
jgi:metallo-beta-lactamase class B